MLALSCLLMQQWNTRYDIMRFPKRKAVNEIPATAKSGDRLLMSASLAHLSSII